MEHSQGQGDKRRIASHKHMRPEPRGSRRAARAGRRTAGVATFVPAHALATPPAAPDLLSDLGHWRALCDSLPDIALCFLTVDGTIAYWSPGAETLTGFTADAILGQPSSMLQPAAERRRRPREEALWKATEFGRWQEQGWRQRRDGSRFWADTVMTALRDNEGVLRGFAAVLRPAHEPVAADAATEAPVACDDAPSDREGTAGEPPDGAAGAPSTAPFYRSTRPLPARVRASDERAGPDHGSPAPATDTVALREDVTRPDTAAPMPAADPDEQDESDLYQAAVAHLHCPLMVVQRRDADIAVALANAAMVALSGHALPDLLNAPCTWLCGPATSAESLNALTAAVRDGRAFRTVLLNYRQDGAPFWGEWHVRPLLTSDGRDGGTLATVEDITERMRAETAWRASQSRLKLLASCEFVAATLTTGDGHIIEANAGFHRLLGYTRAELLSGSLHWSRLLPPNPQTATETHDPPFYRAASGRAMETTLRHKNGHDVKVQLKVVRTDDELPHFLAFLVDAAPTPRSAREREAWRQASRDHNMVREAHATAEAAIRRMQQIQAITDAALSHLEADKLIVALLERITVLLGCDSARLLLVDTPRPALIARATFPLEAADEITPAIPLGSGVLGRIASTRQPVRIGDLAQQESGTLFTPYPVRSFIGAPLLVEGRVTGVLCATCQEPDRFTAEDLSVLQLAADRTAAALERSHLFAAVQTSKTQMQDLSRSLLEVHEAERQHIARELHDEIGQVLTAVKFGLQAVSKQRDPHDLESMIAELVATIEDAICDVRRLSVGLRPPALDALGLEAALREYTDRLAQHLQMETMVQADGLPHRPPASVETACFRVAQEALTNIGRHAKASRVEVTLRERAGTLYLMVTDNGCGFDVQHATQRAQSGDSLGLRSMEQRVVLAGGHFQIQSRPGHGTRLRATFPMDRNTAAASWPDHSKLAASHILSWADGGFERE